MKKPVNKTKVLNATNLKDTLWDTLNKVKEGSIEVKQANSIAGLSKEIIRTINTQIKLSNTNSTNDFGNFNS